MSIGATGDKDSPASKSIKEFLRSYYNKYDSDNNHQMDIRELKLLFRDLGECAFYQTGQELHARLFEISKMQSMMRHLLKKWLVICVAGS
jgi:hypothetical protein